MTNSLEDHTVQKTLELLHAQAKRDIYKLGPIILYKLYSMWKGKELFEVMPLTATRSIYLPVSKAAGNRLYQIARTSNTKLIVEFGCSYGVSTIYLAAAAKDNGGRVITTELDPIKCEIARNNLEKAGLSQYVEIRVGDALKTLHDIDAEVNMLFLDGWKQLYKPLLDMMIPKLSANAVLIADDVNFHGAKAFNDTISSSSNGFIITEQGNSEHGSTFTVSYYKATEDFLKKNNLKSLPLQIPSNNSRFSKKSALILSGVAILFAIAVNKWYSPKFDGLDRNFFSKVIFSLIFLSIAVIAGAVFMNNRNAKKINILPHESFSNINKNLNIEENSANKETNIANPLSALTFGTTILTKESANKELSAISDFAK